MADYRVKVLTAFHAEQAVDRYNAGIHNNDRRFRVERLHRRRLGHRG